jgi:Zn-dependent peptidase ImmA (M78 family)
MLSSVSKRIALIDQFLTKVDRETLEIKASNFLDKINYNSNENKMIDLKIIQDKLNVVFKISESENKKLIGKLTKDIDGKQIIQVDKSILDNKPRLYFTIAHEIAHIELEHNEQTKEELYRGCQLKYKNDEEGKIEESANYFAACVLMPKNKFIEKWNSITGLGDYTKLNLIQIHFGVSRQAVLLRYYCLTR